MNFSKQLILNSVIETASLPSKVWRTIYWDTARKVGAANGQIVDYVKRALLEANS